ncbi:MAG: arginine repressor [Butyrivibrio sp.]|nr:arginine repressor [Butyrivibrio sp.]
MSKSRHDRIVELIRDHEVETQEQLAELLKESGYEVTQATVSRDINKLGLHKISAGGGRQRYVLPDRESPYLDEKYSEVLRAGFLSMDSAQNILVIRTVSGMAMAVAAALDALHIQDVVGCIAGDDTIMAAVRSESRMSAVMSSIRKLLE